MPSPLKVSLSEEEREELIELRKNYSDYRCERALMILMNDEGKTAPQIADILKRHPHTVRDQIKAYKENGIKGLERDYSPGRPSNLREKAVEKVKELIEHSPKEYGYSQNIWKKDLLVEQFKKETGEDISNRTMNRALNEAGYSYKTPQKTVPEKAPSKEEKIDRLKELFEEIEDFAKEDDTEIIMIDETHFSTEPYNHSSWLKRGEHFFPKHSDKKGEPNYFWRLESEEREILLEERQKR